MVDTDFNDSFARRDMIFWKSLDEGVPSISNIRLSWCS